MSSIDKRAFGISDSLVNAVTEALKGGQVKLDKNHNGKLDGQDFKMIRKEENIDELSKKTLGSYVKKASSDAASAYHDSGVAMAQKEPDIRDANKAHGRKRLAGIKTATDKLTKEEVEQVDELSGSLAHRAAHGAWIKTDKAKAAFKGQAKAAAQARKFGQYAAKKGYYDAPKKTNEEAQQVDELSTDTYHSAAKKAAKRAMGDAQGRSGPIFKKYAGMANKFRDKGMSQEKKEKDVKEDIEQVNEIGDTKRGQKLINKVHKRASERLGKAVAKGDAKNARKYQDVGHQAWDRMPSNKYEEVEQVNEISKKLAARYNNKVGPIISKNQNSGGDPAKILKRKNREAGHKLSWNKYHNYKVKVPATEETLGELSKETLGNYVKSASADVGHKKADAAYSRMSGQDKQADKNTDKARKRLGGIYTAVNKLTKEETDPGFSEANDAISKQIAAKKDSFKKQLQQKIASKQMNTMQAKANKRLSNLHASNDKCSCQEGKGKSMTCEVHGDKSKGIKGGKEPIEINPPMKEAAELPKKTITKGHEIAKSLIKHRSKVDNPYAVGMAQAKKSAKMNAYRTDRNKHGED